MLRIFSNWSAHWAAALGSCHMVTSKSKNTHDWKKFARYNIFKNVYIFFMALWERSRARARDQQYQHKVNCTYMYCVYACCWGVGNPDKSFIIFFQHEINHAPLMFLGTDFWSTVPLHHACSDGFSTVINTRYHSEPMILISWAHKIMFSTICENGLQ